MKRLLFPILLLFAIVPIFSTTNETFDVVNDCIIKDNGFIDKVPLGTVPFITTWKTDNPRTSANNQITIPTHTLVPIIIRLIGETAT